MDTPDLPEPANDRLRVESAPLLPHIAKRLVLARLVEVEGYWQEGAARSEEGSGWSEYLRLLSACKDVIEHAPLHPNEVRQVDPVSRMNYALERLTTTLATILPGGLRELEYYLVDETTRERRQQVALARQKKRQAERKGSGT